ncbi:Proline 4-hydroxylase (includes Rps23 Pro-64 3,4-dihydroxylase Tpa1), contains SM-20 domain [Cupriavidus sp. OV038]|jgi:hypothetical protein|uniref:2OG-Fe(II) oxygenase n=1 Tax=unclassified Cupriavidus TaxID=2640874 RepID=UPI0008E9E41E|nr:MULTISPECIES: 2OG-Fe(II) oxygenase [unclassified Cupriavidus]SFC21318.1 Proline 4-hydroxylase (includes Rps23 Pro-64 3,4-dihydroxylase Tpa1), contains SM-20 domain [Cupriavidus sp. OV038]SFP15591.1 Proline 4-hydroxylase (includes Rps23 Pro-64 3,4-dihydroxylase Tpa1), contains SM-20 domain [Cupriavidus sp. OV096]
MHQDLLDVAKLDWISRELSESYSAAAPFPHVCIDNFLDDGIYREASAAFPSADEKVWFTFRSAAENLKLQIQDFYAIPPALRSLIVEFNSPGFIRFLEQLSGIQGLVPDPHLHGGGLHQTLPGGRLGLHIDYNYHLEWKLDRRLNVLLYLNDEWDDNWAGHLQLWDEEVQHCVQNISPIGNRLVVFSTNECSWHGHPVPLACPPGVTRRSIALYYYTNGRPDQASEEHTTRFHARPGERFTITARDILHGMTPPYAKALAKRIVGR